MGKYIENNLNRDEKIIYETSINFASLIPHIILLFAIIGFFTIWKPLIAISTTELGFTNKRIIGKIGLINTKAMDAPLNKINNVSITSGLGGKIFGYSTVAVTTSSGSYTFRYISKADNFKSALMKQIDLFEEDKMKKQAEEMANAFRK